MVYPYGSSRATSMAFIAAHRYNVAVLCLAVFMTEVVAPLAVDLELGRSAERAHF